jgi:hypothetical protein
MTEQPARVDAFRHGAAAGVHPSAERAKGTRRARIAGVGAVMLLAALAAFGIENALVQTLLPSFPRFSSDFSAAYLQREMHRLASSPPRTLVFGDSVLWGYRIAPGETAVALLARAGCACENLSLKSGSPPNTYALVRIALADGVRPRQAVIEINQKAFNSADPGFVTLHPALARTVVPYLSPSERRELGVVPGSVAFPSAWERALEHLSALYAMRSDLRAWLYGDVDAAPAQPITADMLEGTYDLLPLSEKNAGVRYLEKTLDALRAAGVPVLAFLTPTNHRLLHEYIDVPAYRNNGAFLRRVLERHGSRVVDLDAAFPAGEFIDEAHLTPQGQRHLASALAPFVAGTGAVSSGPPQGR